MDTKSIKDGYIFFTMDNSLLSKIIRYVECGGEIRDVPSHVGWVHLVTDEYVGTIEAMYSGVYYHYLNNYYKSGTTIWIARIKNLNVEPALKYAESQVHSKYDFTGIFGIFLRYLIRKYSLNKIKWLDNLLESKTRFFCSEFIVLGASEGGISIGKGDPSFITPYDIFRDKNVEIIDKIVYTDKNRSLRFA